MSVSGGRRFHICVGCFAPFVRAKCSFSLSVGPPFPHPRLVLVVSSWVILRLELRIFVPDSSPSVLISATHLIPSPSLEGLPAACVYLPVLWCHLISSHMVVLWDKHGLVCLITGFHSSVGTGQAILCLWCMFRNTGSLGTQEFWEWSDLGMTLSFKNQKGLNSYFSSSPSHSMWITLMGEEGRLSQPLAVGGYQFSCCPESLLFMWLSYYFWPIDRVTTHRVVIKPLKLWLSGKEMQIM